MSKGLITAIGLIVSIGVVALGFIVVALPIYVQSIAVDAQTAVVASTNALYQSQVDSLREQEENLDEISAEVAGLRAQIPATGQFDDVFELVARAAAQSQVSIVSITVGEDVPFATRAGADDPEVTAPGPDEAPAPEPTPAPDAEGATEPSADPDPGGVVSPGRQQVDFAIEVTSPDMGSVTAFLDALRAGPRLLSSIKATTTDTGENTFTVQISALTYVDSEG